MKEETKVIAVIGLTICAVLAGYLGQSDLVAFSVVGAILFFIN
jgi:hypothetical protein